MTDNIDSLFDQAFFSGVSDRHTTASGAGSITAARVMDGVAHGTTSLRFTTAKAKIPGLTVKPVDNGYVLTGTHGGLTRVAGMIRAYIGADNRVPLHFSEELLNYSPDDELIHKSAVPLWILKTGTDGSIHITRTWQAARG